MKRLLVTGASGYLGRSLISQAAERYQVLALSSRFRGGQEVRANVDYLHCDLTDEALTCNFLENTPFDAVINTAAVNPGGEEATMPLVNTRWPRQLAEHCHNKGVRLVHVSSDMVHDGMSAPYADAAAAAPLSIYGRSKLAGEEAIAQSCPSAMILRSSLIYGLKTIDRGTAGFIERLRSAQPLALFTDVLRQPILDEDLVAALVRLVGDLQHESGNMNMAGSEVMSRHDFGILMLAHWQQPLERVEAVRAEVVAPQVPRDVRLELTRAHRLGFNTRGVHEVLGRLK